jgi:hypothetical protein
MKTPTFVPTLLSAVIAVASTATVRATVYVTADLRELATEARAVAHGRVVSLEARWVDGRRAIETLVTLEVESYAKGDLGESLTLRVPGGQMGPYRSVMLGAPRFVEGEEVIVFLASPGAAIPHLVGLAQGVYRVRLDRATGARMVTPELVQPAGASPAVPARVVRGDGTRRPAPLAAFLDQVRALAGVAR